MTQPEPRLPAPGERTRTLSATPVAARSDLEEIQYYIGVLRKHVRLVAAVPLACGLIAMGASLLRDREYGARAAFLASEPQSMSGSLGSLGTVAAQLGIPGLSQLASGTASLSAQFYGDLLTSNALLSALLNTRYEATAVSEYGGKPFTGTLVAYLEPKRVKTAADSQVATMREFAKENLVVTVDRPTGIVRFQVRTKNRQLSALVARRLLDLVNEFNLRRRQTQAGAERDFDASRAKASLDSLHAAEVALADFRATNIDFSRSPRLATRESELQRRVTLAQQIYSTIAQRYEIANIEAVRNTPIVTVLDAPEGLVEALPRHTAAISVGAFAVGLLLAIAMALRAERLSAAR